MEDIKREDLKNLRKFGKRYANISLFKVEKDVNIFVHLWIADNGNVSMRFMAENNVVYTILEQCGFGFQGNS